ncbi:MAG: hypothetical protein J6S71_02950 [Clostridia bacterium]|nr:hypothetical protein [Clostridia bacterium]
MTEEEYKALEGRFDDRYVKKDVCARNIDAEDKKIHAVEAELGKVKIELGKVSTKLGILIGILSAIGGAVIPLCIKLLFGG